MPGLTDKHVVAFFPALIMTCGQHDLNLNQSFFREMDTELTKNHIKS